jgi:hypothetical protein
MQCVAAGAVYVVPGMAALKVWAARRSRARSVTPAPCGDDDQGPIVTAVIEGDGVAS